MHGLLALVDETLLDEASESARDGRLLTGADLAAAALAVLATVTLGLAGTFRALGQKPAPVLRSL